METNLLKGLAICFVNPKVDSLLVSGKSGVGKSFTLRQACKAWSLPVVDMPLHVSEDMLEERLDIEKTLQEGKKVYEEGLIHRASGGFLYVDDVNLLRPSVLKVVHRYRMERIDGKAPFVLLGSMNPEAGVLSPSDLERFALFVDMPDPDLEKRLEILKALCDDAHGKDKALSIEALPYDKERLEKARVLAKTIEPSTAMMALAASYATQAGAVGNDTESLLLETARAIAALDGKAYILPYHLEEATLYVLPHRMHEEKQAENPPPQEQEEEEPPQNPPPNEEDNQDNSQEEDSQEEEEDKSNRGEEEQEENSQEEEEDTPENQDNGGVLPEDVADISKQFLGLSFDMPKRVDRFNRRGAGKRMLTRTDTSQGRYVRAELPKGQLTDLALDATIRAAAPYQKTRDKKDLAIAIRKSDWRSKVRERRIGRTFLFVVDASGSMGAKKRMEAVKGAIYALLQDAYEKRDRVGLIAFRRQQAELLLPLTRSIELAQRYLETLPTGGQTPLGAGLEMAYQELKKLFLREPHEAPVLVLVTDGRATWAEAGEKPVQVAKEWATKLGELPIESIVIDTEREFISLGISKAIARELKATYYPIKEINENTVISAVQRLEEFS